MANTYELLRSQFDSFIIWRRIQRIYFQFLPGFVFHINYCCHHLCVVRVNLLVAAFVMFLHSCGPPPLLVLSQIKVKTNWRFNIWQTKLYFDELENGNWIWKQNINFTSLGNVWVYWGNVSTGDWLWIEHLRIFPLKMHSE